MKNHIQYRMTRRIAAICTSAIVAASVPAQAEPPEYEFILVDALAPSYNLRETYLYDISEAPMAVGTTSVSDTSAAGNISITTGAMYWTPQGPVRSYLSSPHGVNNNGYIVGNGQAFDTATLQMLTAPSLPGYTRLPVLQGVNDSRVAVGWLQTCSCSNSQGLQQVPYVWDPETGSRSLPVPNASGLSRINSNGLVVGWIGGRASPDSFVYDLNVDAYVRLSTIFSPPPDTYNRKTTAEDVNDSGIVTGSRLGDDLNSTYGYTWAWPNGPVNLLPLPPAPAYRPDVRPKSINSHGQIVGSMAAADLYERAFIYDAAHGLRDLNTLTTVPADFVMRVATRNNDNGWITGWGQGGGGFSRSFILRPLAAACSGDFNRSGTVSVQDIFDFLAAWFGNAAGADFNNSGAVSIQDIFDFIAAWFTGCPKPPCR